MSWDSVFSFIYLLEQRYNIWHFRLKTPLFLWFVHKLFSMCRSEVSVCPPGGGDLRWCQEEDWRLCQWGDISKPASMLWCDIVTRRGLEAVSTRRHPQSASMWWCLWCFINVYSQSRIVTRRGLEAEAVSTKNVMMFYIIIIFWLFCTQEWIVLWQIILSSQYINIIKSWL